VRVHGRGKVKAVTAGAGSCVPSEGSATVPGGGGNGTSTEGGDGHREVVSQVVLGCRPAYQKFLKVSALVYLP
jgi:hypothetical protein